MVYLLISTYFTVYQDSFEMERNYSISCMDSGTGTYNINIYRSSNLNSYVYTFVVQKAIWLNYAYQLEFLAQHTFFQLWLSGSLFFIINAWVMTELIMNHQYETIFNTSDKVRWVWGMGDPGSKRL